MQMELRKFLPLLEESTLARGVENFLTYIADLLSIVFKTRPEMLRSREQTVDIEFVLEHDSMDGLIDALADRRVERLAYSGVRDLADYLHDSLGFDLFTSEADLDSAVRIVEGRNVVVHNRAIVNRVYVSRVRDTPQKIGERLSLDFDGLYRDLAFLATTVRDVDERAAEKWGIERSDFDEGHRWLLTNQAGPGTAGPWSSGPCAVDEVTGTRSSGRTMIGPRSPAALHPETGPSTGLFGDVLERESSSRPCARRS